MIIPLKLWIVIFLLLAGYVCGKFEAQTLTYLEKAWHFVTTPEEWPKSCPSNTICINKADLESPTPAASKSPAN